MIEETLASQDPLSGVVFMCRMSSFERGRGSGEGGRVNDPVKPKFFKCCTFKNLADSYRYYPIYSIDPIAMQMSCVKDSLFG